MNISVFSILLMIYVVIWIKHLVSKPYFTQKNFDAAIVYIHQLWFLQGIIIILIIADVFYTLIKETNG